MTLTLRSATAEDLQALVAIERSIAELPHWPLTEYERYVTSPVGADRVLLVAEVSGVLAGFAAGALASALERVAELESVAVESNARRSGIGRELCRGVIRWSEGKADLLELEVRSRSTHAVALYKSLGFRVYGTRSRYYGNPPDEALLMSRTL